MIQTQYTFIANARGKTAAALLPVSLVHINHFKYLFNERSLFKIFDYPFRGLVFSDPLMPVKADLLESIKQEPSKTNACNFDEA